MSRRRRLQSCLFKTPVAGEDLQFGQFKRFSLRELQLATKGFSPENILEIGAFGNVYKGCLADGSLVAVKRPKEEHPWGGELQLFQTELLMSRLADHQNLLRVHGFCITPTERLLIYPYMATVASLLGATTRQYSQPLLGWPTRKQIAMGAARGLRYLHEQCDFKIVHSDVNSSNILLDENFEAVVGNLGLAKLMDHKDTLITTPICGTARYLATEFISKGELSEKTDVFCYGVMLLELVTGQSHLALELVACQEPVMLLDWVSVTRDVHYL
ncbi:hypothetical protein CDL15_Pgr027602 [Punica granatum]|uniref:non-specific serine/threonine protein kinase n=1 Tax=Punica granatum TaxID=22663 RepID=A0A218XHX8_PUNGR|nr:hypothetical protein CDL15_Pgr027602 [Punica granatum]